MSESEKATLARIHEAATKEFLEKGFRAASLRNIVKAAGVTTGAFYGYYKSKEELFGALVGEAYHGILKQYREVLSTFSTLPVAEQQNHMRDYVYGHTLKMNDYIYDHMQTFRLILCCSEGTEYDHLIHKMAEMDVSSTHDFVSALSQAGNPVSAVHPQLEHILTSGMFSAYFEMFVHDVPREVSAEYTQQLLDFYMAGWQKIMGF